MGVTWNILDCSGEKGVWHVVLGHVHFGKTQ